MKKKERKKILTVKELTLKLQKLIDKHGDLEVVYTSSFKYHVCGEGYCYCHRKNHEFSIEEVNECISPKRGKRKVVKINLDGERRLYES